MAKIRFGTANPLTRQKWSDLLIAYAIGDLIWTKLGLVGVSGQAENPDGDLAADFKPQLSGINTPIIVNKDLVKMVGDKVLFECVKALSGIGQGDDGDPEGNEEAMTVFNFRLPVHERSNAVRMKGKMSGKRTSFNIRSQGKAALGTWLSQKLENDILAAGLGLYNEQGILTVNEAAPSSTRIWYGGQTTAGTIETVANDAALDSTTDNLFGTAVISLMKRKARMATPKIRPIRINGKNYYVMFVHPLQIKAMRSDTNWLAAVRQAQKAGNDNALFSGAAGIWDGVVLIDYDRIPTRTGANGTAPAEGFLLNEAKTETSDPAPDGITITRGMLVGAQAIALGWGQLPTWNEKKFSYGRIPGVATDMIYGAGKVRFSEYDEDAETNTAQADHGVYVFDTVVVPD